MDFLDESGGMANTTVMGAVQSGGKVGYRMHIMCQLIHHPASNGHVPHMLLFEGV